MDIKEIILKFKETKTPLIEVLHEIQEAEGYISPENAKLVSKELNIPLAEVYSVATFYSEFKLEKRGKHLIRFCLGTACAVMHNKKNVECAKKLLGIGLNQTTKDNQFTVEGVNCLGTCSLAPVVEINGKIHGSVTPEKLTELLEDLKKE